MKPMIVTIKNHWMRKDIFSRVPSGQNLTLLFIVEMIFLKLPENFQAVFFYFCEFFICEWLTYKCKRQENRAAEMKQNKKRRKTARRQKWVTSQSSRQVLSSSCLLQTHARFRARDPRRESRAAADASGFCAE